MSRGVRARGTTHRKEWARAVEAVPAEAEAATAMAEKAALVEKARETVEMVEVAILVVWAVVVARVMVGEADGRAKPLVESSVRSIVSNRCSVGTVRT